MTLSRRIAHNTIIQLAGKAVSTVLGLVAVSMITRYLGQEGFGEYTTIVTFLSFFGIIADFGLTLVVTQMISQPGVDHNKVLSNLFTFRLVSALIFIGLGPIVIIFFPYGQIIKTGAWLAALSFFFIALNQIFTGLFQKELRMDKVSLAEVYSRLALLAGVVSVFYFQLGLPGVLAVSSISSALNFLFNFLFSRKFVRLKLAFDREVWLDIIQKSWPLAITIFFNLIYLKADTLILSLIKTPSEVGIYGAAYKVIDILITIPFMFAGLALPVLSARWAENNQEGFKKVFQKSFDLMAVMAVPMIFGMPFVAEKTMALIAGREFAVSGKPLMILIAAASVIFLGTVFSHAIIAINKQKKLIIGYVFTSLTALAGYLYFIPEFSYFGAAWMTVYSESAIALFTFLLFWKYTGIRPKLAILLKSLAASLVMFSALYTATFFYNNLFFLLSVGALAYFSALYLFRGMSFISFKEIFNINK